jgi:hypothetical protein
MGRWVAPGQCRPATHHGRRSGLPLVPVCIHGLLEAQMLLVGRQALSKFRKERVAGQKRERAEPRIAAHGVGQQVEEPLRRLLRGCTSSQGYPSSPALPFDFDKIAFRPDMSR